ncbi:hypothetical protein [uncultured Bacteroides sp.]|uniref:hypothetical protein n=1 Tax=uncultured Bacteroides sp. TaxID=162156 RepID=UPI00280AE364|nr:hypothetical protein [uncultured Bacteroides sp.]
MKLLLIIMFELLIPQFCMPNVFTENKELCLNTFKEYLEAGQRRKEATEFIKLMLKYSDESKAEKERSWKWYQANTVHVDSVMQHCIELTEQGESKQLLNLLVAERENIYAHPNNSISNCWDLHSVYAMLYSIYIKDDKDYYTKIAELAEYSRMQIEVYQKSNEKQHVLYKQVLNELLQIYKTLQNQEKIKEVENIINSLN